MRALLNRLAPERKTEALRAAHGHKDHYQINQRMLASVVGVIAIGLPVGLFAAAKWAETCFRDSISHFYYSPFLGSVFVASLCVIAVFLWAYRGERPIENLFATLAGVAALGVALFPTNGHGCADGGPFKARPILSFAAQADPADAIPVSDGVAEFVLFPFASTVHYGSAAVLFVFLLWYATAVFPAKTTGPQTSDGGARLTRVKATRNAIYYLSAITMAVATAIMLSNMVHNWRTGTDRPGWTEGNWMFWCEAAALIAFGVSWIVKGRIFGLALKDPGE